MTQEQANKIFSSELGQQINVIYVTSDDQSFIRYEEAALHTNELLNSNPEEFVDTSITEWYYIPQYKEIKTSCRTFQLEYEPEVIHIHKVREDEYLVLHEDAYGLNTGKVHWYNKAALEEKYGIILTPNFKKWDIVEVLDKERYDGTTTGFYVKDVLINDLDYPIVIANDKFGKDWVDFINEDELKKK